MGSYLPTLLGINPIPSLELLPGMIYSVNDDNLVYLPNNILYFSDYFSDDDKRDFMEVLRNANEKKLAIIIYYDGMILHGVRYSGEPMAYFSRKISPTTWGPILND